MYLFENLKEIASSYLPPEQVEKLRQAYVVARDAHQGQMRSSGEPYITHPVAVARILGDMRLDHETLMAAVLHDVIEDTPVTKDDLAELFGNAVAELVSGTAPHIDRGTDHIENGILQVAWLMEASCNTGGCVDNYDVRIDRLPP